MRTFALLLALLTGFGAQANDAVWTLLGKGGQVVLIRHASTVPGTGDPPGFRLNDCATQRNLSDTGRAEARQLGEAFVQRVVPIARVLASPWCRCIETATLAFGSKPQTHPALANLYGRPQNHDRQIAQFRQLIASPPRGGNLVLVSHGSTTGALTGEYPAQGEAIVITPLGGGKFRLAGRIAPPVAK